MFWRILIVLWFSFPLSGWALEGCGSLLPLQLDRSSYCRLSEWNAVLQERWCVDSRVQNEFWQKCDASWVRRLDRYRVQISDSMVGFDPGGVLRSLLLGEKNRTRLSDGDPPIYELMRILGFVHILNATGVHLWGLYGAVLLLGRSLSTWGMQRPRVQRCIRQMTRFVAVSCFVWAWLLAGMRPGMLRPLVLIGVQGVGQWLGWRWQRGAALLVTLVLDFAASWIWSQHFAPGRWIYALAVSGAIASVVMGAKISHLRLAFASWIPTAFYEAATEGWISWFTPLGSWLTTIGVCFVMYPVLVFKTILGELNFEGWFFSVFSRGLFFLLSLSLSFPGIWWVNQKSVFLAVGVSLGVWFFFKGKKAVCLIFISAALVLFLGSRDGNKSRLLQIDVAQGDSAYFRTQEGRHGLIDVGSGRIRGYEKWLRFFAKNQVDRLSWVVLTHEDEDHAGALGKISGLISVEQVIRSEKEFNDEVSPFTVIEARVDSRRANQRNQRMNLFLFSLGGGTAYINPGDADRAQEKRWLPEVLKWLKTNQIQRVILKAGHHGSRTSSDPLWLSRLDPQEVWISSGKKNRYHHPHSEVIREMTRSGYLIRRTDQEGDLEWKL